MIEYDWKDAGNDSVYCFRKNNGQIVGIVHKIAHTDVYMSKIIKGNDEHIIGRFINQECAKVSLFEFWDIENRTLIENK